MARTTKIVKAASMSEIGTTGLRVFGDQISEEFLRQLVGLRGVKEYIEMRDNDPIIGSILFIIDKLLRNVRWEVEPASLDPEAEAIAEFVESCMQDMTHTWEEFISEVLSMLVFGHSVHEIVYKLRSETDSDFPDGKIGWKRLPIRAQETLDNWKVDEYGELQSIIQRPVTGTTKELPIDKLLIFKTVSYKNNPKGRSILRNAYVSYKRKKKIEEIEGIGVERDLAGLPVFGVPANILAADASPEEKATLDACKRTVINVRRDAQEGLIIPLAYDDQGNKIYDLTLLSTGGTRQFDTNAIITRYGKVMAMTVAADFIFLGQDKVGSFSLSSDKTSMFTFGLGAWLKDIAAVINKKAISGLMKVNGIPRELWPKAMPSDIEKENIMNFVDSIYKLVGVGAMIPDESIDAKARELLDLPLRMSTGTFEEDIMALQNQQVDMSPDNKGKQNNQNPGGGANPNEA